MCSPANAAEIVAELLSYLEVPKCLFHALGENCKLDLQAYVGHEA